MDGKSKVLSYNFELKLYSFILSVFGLIVFVINLIEVNLVSWKETAVFVFLSLLAQLLPARLPRGDVFSIAVFVDLGLIVLFGTSIAVSIGYAVTVVAGFLSIVFGRKEAVSNIFKSAAQNALVIGSTGFVYTLIGNEILAFIGASIAYFTVHTFFISINSRLYAKKPSNTGWLSVVRMLYLNYAVLTIMAFIMTEIYKDTSSEWRLFNILLFFIPILLVSHSFRLYTNIRQSYLNTVKAMVAAIEAKDPYTKGHSERVAELTLAVAREFGIPDRELQKLEYAALLHDAGKIGIPEQILNKPCPLSTQEYEEVKKHSVLGAEILQKIKFLSSKSDVVLHHHERYDGSGYPAGLSGNNIPLESRILAVADTYDAMTTDRPFRAAKTPAQAMEEMERLSEVQFDPRVMKVFKTVIKKRGEL